MTDHPDIVERLTDGWSAEFRRDGSVAIHASGGGLHMASLSEASMAREITRLRAEAEALRKDAARYLWLRDVGDDSWVAMAHRLGTDGPHMIDAAIDAAIAATKEQQA